MLRRILSVMASSLKRASELLEEASIPKIPRIQENQTQLNSDSEKVEEIVKPRRKPKPQKFAILVSFCGREYFGMQVQTSVQNRHAEYPSIEGVILKAFVSQGLYTQEDCDKPGGFKFQRAARTDKGVSAVRQIISCQLPLDYKQPEKLIECRDGLNSYLPDVIRIMGIKRATRSFDARFSADSRSYSYTLPTFAFAHLDELTTEDFRITPERIAEIDDLLSIFKGTHNFCNYSAGWKFTQEQCKRHMQELKCSEPFVRNDIQFVSIHLKGQSFIFHQIRKMIGMVISIVRGYGTKSSIQEAFEKPDIHLPIAPALGLLLERVHYEKNYERKFKDTHPPITLWPEYEEKPLQNPEEELEAEITPIKMAAAN